MYLGQSSFYYMRKNYYELFCDLIFKSIYKKFLCGGKIGIGVILYEKGKGKFVGDWKNPPHKNCKQTKGIFVQLLRCKAKQLNSFEQGLE